MHPVGRYKFSLWTINPPLFFLQHQKKVLWMRNFFWHFSIALVWFHLNCWISALPAACLYNFHLPYLVTFLNTLFFCFVPKYLGIPVLTEYFVNNCLFPSWGRPPFLLSYPNFWPLLHHKYKKCSLKPF